MMVKKIMDEIDNHLKEIGYEYFYGRCAATYQLEHLRKSTQRYIESLVPGVDTSGVEVIQDEDVPSRFDVIIPEEVIAHIQRYEVELLKKHGGM